MFQLVSNISLKQCCFSKCRETILSKCNSFTYCQKDVYSIEETFVDPCHFGTLHTKHKLDGSRCNKLKTGHSFYHNRQIFAYKNIHCFHFSLSLSHTHKHTDMHTHTNMLCIYLILFHTSTKIGCWFPIRVYTYLWLTCLLQLSVLLLKCRSVWPMT